MREGNVEGGFNEGMLKEALMWASRLMHVCVCVCVMSQESIYV